ncbi:MAG TPA: hypothetical protein VK629_12995 [Steroidobacteraceae bacterium]|nr:hypothetical protein [Steroidobacteraceae bacterium]
MLRLRPQLRTLLVLLCLSIVVMRVGGVHLHYCFDGAEPPVSWHMDGDADSHHKDILTGSPDHKDVDVSVSVEALVKKVPGLLDLLGILVVAVIALLLPRLRSDVFSLDSAVVHCAQPAYLRPPLRGPPL